MAVTIHQQVAIKTRAMEAAILAALEAIDDYSATIARLLKEQGQSDVPNEMLQRRFRQFLARAESMTATIEDDVMTELLFCLDRLFAVDLAEKGEFI